MSAPPTKVGTIPFHIPGIHKACYTWCKIIGDITPGGKVPLIMLHGGPGACHDYLLPFIDLFTQQETPIIFYDQIGNGRSTHLEEKNGDEGFWTESLFIRELDNRIDCLKLRANGFNLYGQSWGGMLGSAYAAQQPKGLKKLVIANTPASMALWVDAATELRKGLPEEIQKILDRAEKSGDFESEEYKTAVMVYYKKHLCRLGTWPKELLASLEWLEKDNTVYGTMQGPSELTTTGTLKDWTVIDRLKNIEVPILVYNSKYDEAQDICVEPYFWGSKKVKWVTLQGASHMAHFEKREEVMKLVGSFLIGLSK